MREYGRTPRRDSTASNGVRGGRDGPMGRVLALQRTAGNRATRRVLARRGFYDYLRENTKGDRTGYGRTVTKQHLYDYLSSTGQDKQWIDQRLRKLPASWTGEMSIFGGEWGYEPQEYDPPEISDIMRTIREASSGRLKKGVLDYAGENRRDATYKWCTESFVRKHVLPLGPFKSAMKHGKARMAAQANISANSVIDPSDMRNFEAEIASRQDEFGRAYTAASEQAYRTGTVNRGLDFHTNAKFEVATYEAGKGDATMQRGHVEFAVVEIDGRFVVNHFGGVTP